MTETATPAQLPYPTAGWPHRILALVVDWLVSSLVLVPFLGPAALPVVGGLLADRSGSTGGWVLLVYLIESVVLTTLAGGSFGKLATRLRTVRVAPDGGADPRPLDPLRSVARQILIVLVIPPLVFRSDGRGLHDILASTASVTLATYRSFFLHKD